MSIPNVCLLMAMHAEARPVIDRLGLEEVSPPWPDWMPMRLYQRSRPTRVSLLLFGRDERFGVDLIGTQAATLAASQSVEHLRPDLVISAGTCGGFLLRGGAIGDVYLSEGDFVFHDRRVPLEGFHESSLGQYPSMDVRALAAALGLKTGVVTTGDALDALDACRERMEGAGASVKEMEAAAIAWVCSLAGVPMFAVKAVTDLVDGEHPTEAEFVQNLSLAVDRLAGSLDRVLRALSSEPPAGVAQ
ncbi:MAG: 5'-methylthioadenosine nucleosidase [Planctomycetota bacterium]